jgi:hypothetical protein
VLSFARARAKNPAEAEKQRMSDLGRLRAYASLLGDERADTEMDETRAFYSAMDFSPSVAKMGITSAFARQRGTKKFDK